MPCTLLAMSFTSLPMSCTLLSTSRTVLPTSCMSPPTYCILSLASFTLSSTPCVIFRGCADAIRASFCVNLSNSCSASSIAAFPRTLFNYFSEHVSVKNSKPRWDQLTQPATSYFLRRDPEDHYHLHHDLRNNFRRGRSRRNCSTDLEPMGEESDPVELVDELVLTGARVSAAWKI